MKRRVDSLAKKYSIISCSIVDIEASVIGGVVRVWEGEDVPQGPFRLGRRFPMRGSG